MPKEKKKWYEPAIRHTGWKKDLPTEVRRRRQLLAHKNDPLASARSLQALANITMDKETEDKARADAMYFYRQHKSR